MFPIIILIFMFFVWGLALVQSAIEFVKETLAASGLSHEAQFLVGFPLLVIGAILAALGLVSVLYIVDHRPDD